MQKILTTLESLKSAGVHWEQVIPVFLSAFFAMLIGISIELFKSRREKSKAAKEQEKRELQQINVAVVSIGYNIEVLLHAVFQNIFPHREQSYEAYKELHATNGDGEKIKVFGLSLHKYPALMMTGPEMHFIESDYVEKMPFIIEKNAELLKQFAWLLRYSRLINNTIKDRNKFIEVAIAASSKGGLSYYQLESIIHTQVSIADSECINALQFFESLQNIAKSLEELSNTYKVPGVSGKRLIPPPPLEDAIKKLREFVAVAIPKMPQ